MIKNGLLTFPVYHGTSSVLLNEIKASGLGANSLESRYNLIEKMRVWLEHADSMESHSDLYLRSKPTIKMICRQDVEFLKYKSVYFSASQKKAASYASHAGGPEIIRYARILADEVQIHDAEMIDVFNKFKEHQGVVLKVEDLPIDSVSGEKGENLESFLEGYRNAFNIVKSRRGSADDYMQSANFRVDKVIPWEKIEIVTI